MAVSGKKSLKARKRRGIGANATLQQAVMMHVRAGTTSASEVRRLLIDQFLEPNVPSERTIRDMIKEVGSWDSSDEWTLAEASLDEISLVAPVWAEARAKGFKLTVAEAEWVSRMRRASPDLPLHDAWALAMYRVRFSPEDGEWIDALVAFEPYLDVEHCERYFAAANAGHISAPEPACTVATEALTEAGRSLGPEAEKFIGRQIAMNSPENRFRLSEEQIDGLGLRPVLNQLREAGVLDQITREGIDGSMTSDLPEPRKKREKQRRQRDDRGQAG